MTSQGKSLRFVVGAVLCIGAIFHVPMVASAQGTEASAAKSTRAADEQTNKIVLAANVFFESLTPEQKKSVLFAYSDSEQRARWSNLPLGLFTRAGVRLGEMNDIQRTALMKLMGTILSPTGLRMVHEQMAADDVLKTHGGNRPDLIYGYDHFYVSFLGAPSTTAPWMLQFGGHHLAINATVVGANVTLSPSLTGGQPIKFTSLTLEPVSIAQDEISQAALLIGSLTDVQRRKAVISTKRIDLVLGPGQDGKTLQPEGLPGSEMTSAQKTYLLQLIKARLGILNADNVAAKIAAVRKNLDKTYFAWFGPVAEVGASYYRVTGPTILLEFAPQDIFGGDAAQHLHNMYRDPTNEYGAAWTSHK